MMNSAWMMWLAGGFLLAVLPLLWLMQRNALLLIQTGVAEDRKPDGKPAGPVPRRPISKQLGRLPIYRESGDVWREARQRSRRVAGLALLLRHAGIINPREQLALTASGLLLAALVVGLV